MAARYLIDSDICIYFRRSRSPKVLARAATLEVGEAVMSVITYGELAFGAEKSSERARAIADLDRLTALIPVDSLPEEAGKMYGDVRALLAPKGRLIGPNDLWIAAHALARGLILVTNNEREFSRIPQLRLENWAR
ncbi:MAG: type II toxin-antitoxin system VapC family toxin [Alphaproteobacteria bacterium]|nr:type II toxin-antitoxin system VapC family toxin [Alphaproteobacteria bacterium]MBV9062259.1 type II toxin-antitoxin system VapC family toxin [Alphaproteobacteria bacterium]